MAAGGVFRLERSVTTQFNHPIGVRFGALSSNGNNAEGREHPPAVSSAPGMLLDFGTTAKFLGPLVLLIKSSPDKTRK